MQVRSEGSQAYPKPDFRDGRVSTTRSESSRVHPSSGFRDGRVSTTDSIRGIPSSHIQTQYRTPTYHQSFNNGGRNLGTGGSGQFSLQSAHEGEYQLNLPLGLRAGNAYRGGVRSSGHYGVEGPQPQLTTEFQQYPDSIHPSVFQQPGHLSQPLPPISTLPGVPHLRQVDVIPARPFLSGYSDTDVTQRRQGTRGTGVESIPSLIKPEISAPTMSGDIPGVSNVSRAHRIYISDGQSDFRAHTPGQQLIPTRTGYSEIPLHPGSSISSPGSYVSPYQPQVRTPFIQTPERIFQRHGDLPRHISTEIPGSQITGTDFYPGPPNIPRHDGQIPIHQPGISSPSIYMPGRDSTQDQTAARTLESQAIGVQPTMRLPPLSHQIPDLNSDLRHQQQYLPSISTSDQQYQKASHLRYSSGQDGGTMGMRPGIPTSYPSSYPALTSMNGQRVPHPSSLTVPALSPYLTPAGTDKIVRGDTRYSNGLSPHTGITRDHFPGDFSFRTPGISRENGGIPTTDMGSENAQFRGTSPSSPKTISGYQTPDEIRQNGRIPDSLYDSRGIATDSSAQDGRRFIPGQTGSKTLRTFGQENVQYRGTGPIPPETISGHQTPDVVRQDGRVPDALYDSRGIAVDSSSPDGRRIIPVQTGSEALRAYGQDSASSQTQIQTGQEGTAAEASAAGQHGGLGSQTQVQGGYAGNGSFSAQAQSGFIGGIVQSQVQGSKQGGLSGSSAQVERVGSAQSQVQVGKPSGAASSTAQGKFTRGSTQVQAQGGKTGGSAGAQSQSTGLSSSHVQVNIGGKDANEQEDFQGTVSASVQGGHSSGQSQTQLHGGYNSGRSYVATAQGGFDSTSGFQASLPLVDSLRIPDQTMIGRYPFTESQGQESLGITDGRQVRAGSTRFGQPTTDALSKEEKISKTVPRGQESFTHLDQSPTLLDTRQLPNKQYQQPFPLPGSLQQQTLIPPHSLTQYPSSVQETQRQTHLPSASQLTSAHQYPRYQTDLTGASETATRTRLPARHDFPTYRGNGQRQPLPFGSPQINELGIQRPESTLYRPEIGQPTSTRDLSYPHSVISPFQYPTDQKSNDTVRALVPPSHRMQTDDLRYTPAYSTGLRPQIPSSQSGLQTGIRQPSTFMPVQPQISIPSSRIISPGQRTDGLPVLTRQDDLQGGIRPSQILPDQFQISMPSSQIIPSKQRFDGMPDLARPDIKTGRPPQVQPEQSKIPPLSPQGRSELPDVSALKPQTLPTTPRVPAPSTATGTMHGPGVSEPDQRSCCEALRNLKQRCCGRSSTNGAQCCQSSQDDLFDFSSEDNLDESKGPCKVVKAICYIVYKPVGKARVCKPTSSNQC